MIKFDSTEGRSFLLCLGFVCVLVLSVISLQYCNGRGPGVVINDANAGGGPPGIDGANYRERQRGNVAAIDDIRSVIREITAVRELHARTADELRVVSDGIRSDASIVRQIAERVAVMEEYYDRIERSLDRITNYYDSQSSEEISNESSHH